MNMILFFIVILKLAKSSYVHQRKYFKQNYGKFYKFPNKNIPGITKFYSINAKNELECIRKCYQDSANCNAMNVIGGSATHVICDLFIDNGQLEEKNGYSCITRRRPVMFFLFLHVFKSEILVPIHKHLIDNIFIICIYLDMVPFKKQYFPCCLIFEEFSYHTKTS